jgi:hypothetical protein
MFIYDLFYICSGIICSLLNLIFPQFLAEVRNVGFVIMNVDKLTS